MTSSSLTMRMTCFRNAEGAHQEVRWKFGNTCNCCRQMSQSESDARLARGRSRPQPSQLLRSIILAVSILFPRNISLEPLTFACFPGKAPLHLTSFEGDAKMTKALIQCKADVSNPDDSGRPPMHWAVTRSHPDVIRVLADAGASVDLKGKTGKKNIYLQLT